MTLSRSQSLLLYCLLICVSVVCVCFLCVWAGLPAVTAFYLPPLPGEFQTRISQIVDPSSSTHCNCDPASASHRYSPSVTLILSLILVLMASYG
ncbi:unnamed protein product, partial [Staurois parvus]